MRNNETPWGKSPGGSDFFQEPKTTLEQQFAAVTYKRARRAEFTSFCEHIESLGKSYKECTLDSLEVGKAYAVNLDGSRDWYQQLEGGSWEFVMTNTN